MPHLALILYSNNRCMGAYSRGALIKKFQSKGGRLFERSGNLRVGANSSIYGNLFSSYHVLIYLLNLVHHWQSSSKIHKIYFRGFRQKGKTYRNLVSGFVIFYLFRGTEYCVNKSTFRLRCKVKHSRGNFMQSNLKNFSENFAEFVFVIIPFKKPNVLSCTASNDKWPL